MLRACNALSIACGLLLGGCSQWNSSSPFQSQWLKPPKLAADGALFEIAVVDVGQDDGSLEAELWRETDEQSLPTEVRRRLAAAGMRCGSLGSEIPEHIRKWLEAQQASVALDEKDGAAVISDVPTQRRLQCRSDRPQFIVVGKPRSELILNQTSDGESHRESYTEAGCELRLTANPQGDGRVRVVVTPGIRHGAARQCWVGDQGLFRLDNSRQCKWFEDCRVEATLIPGQTLLWGSAALPQGLGRAFFASDEAGNGMRKIVVVRLAHSKLDDLFAPQRASTPIVTPAP